MNFEECFSFVKNSCACTLTKRSKQPSSEQQQHHVSRIFASPINSGFKGRRHSSILAYNCPVAHCQTSACAWPRLQQVQPLPRRAPPRPWRRPPLVWAVALLLFSPLPRNSPAPAYLPTTATGWCATSGKSRASWQYRTSTCPTPAPHRIFVTSCRYPNFLSRFVPLFDYYLHKDVSACSTRPLIFFTQQTCTRLFPVLRTTLTRKRACASWTSFTSTCRSTRACAPTRVSSAS